MAVTLEELDRFHAFAKKRLVNGAADASWEDLLADFREFEETCEELREALAEFEQGSGTPVEEVFAEIREKYGLGEKV